jgi:hypothetical protein
MNAFGKHSRLVFLLFGLSFGAQGASAGWNLWRGDMFPPVEGDPVSAALPTHRWMMAAVQDELRRARQSQLVYSLLAMTLCLGVAAEPRSRRPVDA